MVKLYSGKLYNCVQANCFSNCWCIYLKLIFCKSRAKSISNVYCLEKLNIDLQDYEFFYFSYMQFICRWRHILPISGGKKHLDIEINILFLNLYTLMPRNLGESISRPLNLNSFT